MAYSHRMGRNISGTHGVQLWIASSRLRPPSVSEKYICRLSLSPIIRDMRSLRSIDAITFEVFDGVRPSISPNSPEDALRDIARTDARRAVCHVSCRADSWLSRFAVNCTAAAYGYAVAAFDTCVRINLGKRESLLRYCAHGTLVYHWASVVLRTPGRIDCKWHGC